MMDAAVSGEVTQLLLAWRGGDESALERLLPLVHEELRRLAHHHLRRERAGHTLQTTALVNEAYLRLVRSSRVEWQNRAHLFAVAAQLMRRVLVDEARQRGYLKQGGAFTRVALAEDIAMAPERNVDLLALDEALGRLERSAPRKCRVIELRFFGGLSIEETAAVLGVHADTVKCEWRTAKLWLWRELSGAKEASDGTDTLESD